MDMNCSSLLHWNCWSWHFLDETQTLSSWYLQEVWWGESFFSLLAHIAMEGMTIFTVTSVSPLFAAAIWFPSVKQSLQVSSLTFCQHYQVEVSRILNMLAFTYERKGKSDTSISCAVETPKHHFSRAVTGSLTKFCSTNVFSPNP